MIIIMVMSAKMVTLGFFRIKVCWNKGYGVIISAHDVPTKFYDVTHIFFDFFVNVVMCPKISNCSTSMREVIKTSVWPEISIFRGVFLKIFNNLEMALGMALKF